jgi:hypothetical protein
MSKAEDYRRLAAECLTMAQGNVDWQSRRVLLHMADGWIKLAELAREDAPVIQQQQQIQPKKPDDSPHSN